MAEEFYERQFPETEDETLTDEDKEVLEQLGYGYPKQEEKVNVYSYFKKVLAMKDNLKTANLKEEELGTVVTPVRTNEQIALYCESMGMKGFADYFKKESQILLASSLSRDGFLDKLAVTQKREMETKTKEPKLIKRGWFKPKEIKYE